MHIGSEQYAKGWGQRVVIVEFDPRDVVSVPRDREFQKLRVCKYKVVAEYQGRMTDGGVLDPATPYTAKEECPEIGVSCAGCEFDSGDQEATLDEVAYDLGAEDAADDRFPRTCEELIEYFDLQDEDEEDAKDAVVAYYRGYRD